MGGDSSAGGSRRPSNTSSTQSAHSIIQPSPNQGESLVTADVSALDIAAEEVSVASLRLSMSSRSQG